MSLSEKLLNVLEQFMDVVHAESGFPVLIYDDKGIIIRATETYRIGNQHAGAVAIMEGLSDEYAVTAEEADQNSLVKEGYNCPVYFNGKKVCAFGITGKLEAAKPVAKIAVKIISSWLKEVEYKEELERSERKFRNIFNDLQDIYFETTYNGKVKTVSPSVETYTGYTVEEAISRGAGIFYDDPGDRDNLIDEIKAKGNTRDLEMRFKKKNGSLYDVSINADVIYDSKGNPEGLKGTIRDITARKNAERMLMRSEEKFRQIFEHAPLGIMHYDSNGIITACNDNFVKIIGSSREKLVGLNMRSLPDHRIINALKKALDGEVGYFEGDYSSTTAQKVTPVRLIFSPVLSKQEKPDGGIGIVEDVTERRAAEKKLIESEKRFRELAELLPETIYEVDLTGKLTFVNKPAFKLFGYTREDFKKGINVFEFIRERDKARAFKNIKKILLGESVGIKEYEVRRKDGSFFPALFHSSVMYQNGEPVGFRGFLIDMTEKKRTQELLIQSEKMMSIGGLAAGMAHEINNPLAGITQNAQVLINRLTTNLPANKEMAEEAGTSLEAIESYMEKRGILNQIGYINASALRAAEIVTNMLSFARKSETLKAPHDLAALVTKTIELLKNDYSLKKGHDFKNIKIIKSFDAGLKKVCCEEIKIQQVFINIIKNSIDAAADIHKRAEDICLKIKLANEWEKVRIEIEDNGPGIDRETRKRIFEPFFTTKSVDKGTGLGLSLSYFIIVDDHKGEMEVQSSTGKGTKFIIRLPVS